MKPKSNSSTFLFATGLVEGALFPGVVEYSTKIKYISFNECKVVTVKLKQHNKAKKVIKGKMR